jgi:hypothetical protein
LANGTCTYHGLLGRPAHLHRGRAA